MRRTLSVAILFAVITAPIFAQVVSPNVEKGITPGKAFDFSDVDNVNLFNGNLGVSIPLGQEYSVNSSLSYRLVLHYSGNAWEHAIRDEEILRQDLGVFEPVE